MNNFSNYLHNNSIKNMTFTVQTIDKYDSKWGHEKVPQRHTEEFMRFSAKMRAKWALFDTVHSFVREHFANGEGFDPDDVNFGINPLMLFSIDKEHQRAKLRVRPMREN